MLAAIPAIASGGQPKAVFIIIDGISADTIESVATPHLDEIAGDDGYARAYVGGEVGDDSESPTVSAVGYNSLLTGTWSNKHNVWTNLIVNPNYDYWDVFRIAKHHDPELRTAIYSTWTDNRSKLIGDGLARAGGRKLDYSADGFELDTERFPHDENADYIRNIDAVVTEMAAQHIASDAPDLSWVYLQYTDDVAHTFGDSPEMNAAVRLMDAQLGRIWNAVKQRMQSHGEDWLVVVTTDHGRDAATGKHHGGQSERERRTWIATNSNKLNSGFYQNPAIVDILPSIARHLEVEMPIEIREQLDGQSFID